MKIKKQPQPKNKAIPKRKNCCESPKAHQGIPRISSFREWDHGFAYRRTKGTRAGKKHSLFLLNKQLLMHVMSCEMQMDLKTLWAHLQVIYPVEGTICSSTCSSAGEGSSQCNHEITLGYNPPKQNQNHPPNCDWQ